MVIAAGKMYRPTDIENNTVLDTVYVVEQRNHRVSKWTYNPPNFVFTLDETWGSNGDGTSGQPGQAISDDDDKLFFPTGILAKGSNQLLVTDTFNNRIRILAEDTGDFTGSIGGPGVQGDLEFYRPTYMNRSDTRIAIVDSRNARVAVFNNTLAFLGSSDGTFHTPNGAQLGTSPSGEFFYTDLVRGTIDRYSTDGTTFLDSFGTPGTDPSVPSQLFYPGSGNGRNEEGQQIFADTRNNRIKRFDSGGTFSTEGNLVTGTGDGQLYWPASVTGFTDTAHYNLVANTLNNRIDAFDGNWNFQVTFGAP